MGGEDRPCWEYTGAATFHETGLRPERPTPRPRGGAPEPCVAFHEHPAREPSVGILRSMSIVVPLSAIEEAAERIAGVVRRTPLVELSLDGGVAIRAKCENLQAGGAFKLRGAYNFIAQLSPEERREGVITYSSGNHAQAVALAAGLVGVPAVVVMPTTAPSIKVEGARALGAEVIFAGTTSVERKARAEAVALHRDLRMVPPFDHPWIIAGQGTVGLEILRDCPEVARVLVPVGGGGLLAGVSAAIKQRQPAVQVVGVEPAGAAKMHASLAAGRPVTLDSVSSIADGLLPLRPGDLTYEHVRRFVDETVTVSDDAIADAVLWLFRRGKLVVETSGAATLAAVMSGHQMGAAGGGPTVVVLSGGNMALESLAELAEAAANR
jgi:threonine dehydratase